MLKVKVLGSGTSTGVPEVGCTCPDFRQQMLSSPFGKIDGVLITHEHYDHVGGLDDMRSFCRFGEVPVYAEEYTARRLKTRMPYCFAEKRYLGVPDVMRIRYIARKYIFGL